MSEQIGRYRIIGKLGEGGMGVVYEAIDDRLERPIALKVIREETTDDAARERFWREARLAASVNHPHICQLYEIGEADGQLFIAMERLEGEPLAALLARGPVLVVETVRLGLQLLDALSALHGRGIVHRDLKPSNVFLTQHGIKLLDFGLARPAASTSASRRASRSPEPSGFAEVHGAGAASGQPVGRPGGSVCHGRDSVRDAVGHPAFDAGAIATLVEQILHGDQPVLGGSPAIATFDRIIHRALAKAPHQRYASAAAMADDLRSVLVANTGDEPTRARPVTRLMVMPFRLLRDDAEIDFLAFSLADAMTNSLSSLESLVVRSTLAASRLAGSTLDLKPIASEAGVEVVLTGTLLRAGDQLRVSTQLIEAPAGTVLWSHTSQASLGDVFRLQDDLSKRIVESLALPLSGREKRALSHDVPSSAKAYEFYLRGNMGFMALACLGHPDSVPDFERIVRLGPIA